MDLIPERPDVPQRNNPADANADRSRRLFTDERLESLESFALRTNTCRRTA